MVGHLSKTDVINMKLKTALLALSISTMSGVAMAQEAATKVVNPPAPAQLAPDPLIGQPIAGQIGIQPQVTEIGQDAQWFHDAMLMPIITVITLFVLALMFWVAIRYRRKANPVPSKTSHNTLIEVLWTLIPALILVVVAVPSIGLLARQFKPAGKDAVVVKVVGHQWNWSYFYPDHLGDTEILANMLPEKEAKAKGEPRLLGVDNRMVVPVDTEIKVIVTSDDVIHSWAVPAFWTKMDAVPGRLNEVTFKVQTGKEGVYYGQCSELCGVRHGFMPIAVEVVSKENFVKWVASKGGSMPGTKPVAAAAATPATPAPAAAALPPTTTAPTPAVAATATPANAAAPAAATTN
jgi:cytochrome c oxidase subunit II